MQLTACCIVAVLGSFFGDAHTDLGIHKLDGADPPAIPDIPEISGPFEMSITIRFDDLTGGLFQPIYAFQIINGTDLLHLITLFQDPEGTGLEFTVVNSTQNHKLITSPGVLVAGEVAKISMGVLEDGTQWLQKQGGTLFSEPGVIPEDVVRVDKLLGFFDDVCQNCVPMRGAILGLTVRNLDEDFHPRMLKLNNYQSQIQSGGFVASFYARFDNVTNSSAPTTVFCLADAYPYTNFVSLRMIDSTGQMEVSMRLVDTTVSTLVVNGAAIQDEMSFWHVSLNPSGLLSLDRDGMVLGSMTLPAMPPKLFRRTAGFGEGCESEERLDGVLLGFRIDLHTAS